MDRAIRVSTAVVVLAVAGIAAYISYLHAYAVVREYGESDVTAQLEPATIDGLVYGSSMVILYAARHRLPVPRLARWMLALGILASLAVNVAQGWSHGLVGAVAAAWPAASLVGSYELLAWIIWTASTGGPDHAETGPWPAPGPVADAGPANRYEQVMRLAPVIADNPLPQVPAASVDSRTGDGLNVPDHPDQAADHPDQVPSGSPAVGNGGDEIDTNAAAVTAYRTSIEGGQPISEGKLAEMFGKTFRRWARMPAEDYRAEWRGLPDLRQLTPTTITSPAELLVDPETTRDCGFSVNRSERVPGVCGPRSRPVTRSSAARPAARAGRRPGYPGLLYRHKDCLCLGICSRSLPGPTFEA